MVRRRFEDDVQSHVEVPIVDVTLVFGHDRTCRKPEGPRVLGEILPAFGNKFLLRLRRGILRAKKTLCATIRCGEFESPSEADGPEFKSHRQGTDREGCGSKKYVGHPDGSFLFSACRSANPYGV